MTKTSLKLPSFAKINWFLRILGKRPDGYHEVITALQTVSLHDFLVFELREDGNINLVCDDPEIPVDDNNLIVKAARALQAHLNSKLGADIKLTKRIPTQAGLGGASSNAAVTLTSLNVLWDGRTTARNFMRISSELGSDVPFFLMGGEVIARGTGTDFSWPPERPKQHLIIVTPNAKVSTANAYAALNAPSLTTSDAASILSSSLADLFSAGSGQVPLHNDFEGVIFELEPEIKRAKEALWNAGARGALLAGSGSSVFGIFNDKAARDQALGNLRSEAGWRVFSCHTLSRSEYCQATDTGA